MRNLIITFVRDIFKKFSRKNHYGILYKFIDCYEVVVDIVYLFLVQSILRFMSEKGLSGYMSRESEENILHV